MGNPCKDVKYEPLCTMGVGGTRLHISGTKEEVFMVRNAIEEYEMKGPRRSARMPADPTDV